MDNPNIEASMDTLIEYYSYTPRTTLNRMKGNENAFKILISCLLSLRVKDYITERVCRELFLVADNPDSILNLDNEKLEEIIFSTGHYRRKAQVLKHVSKDIIQRFNRKVPSTREELMSIKGIGPKTANIVLNFAFDKDVLPIDTHCHRVPNRIGWIKTKNPENSEIELMKILPKKYWGDFNGIFLLFGKNICVPINPFCSKCPIERDCIKEGVIKSR